jgi:hypothetical protein
MTKALETLQTQNKILMDENEVLTIENTTKISDIDA